MKHSHLIKGIALGVALAGGFASFSYADGMTFQAKKVTKKATITQANIPKPPKCATGFTVVGKKLITHEGNKWWEYTCAYQKTVTRICNADTVIDDIKNKFISLPSDGQSSKTKVQMSYKCINYNPVE